ncbi:FAD-dependent oxidoreductase [Streptomyces sp. CB03238]|uniref:hydroxysqualene dehydroxylase n=1 Tax=Streptomyces sp. CB03238 TaxID=1907777 RepID=UPI000A10630A|nr:FAD-dependent oxidoreductase [Streptomyces sp. CB03238]ORT57105.1 FAD-dependent oxidoreductase [Streptomyces sp. CB03238]
MSPDLGSVAVLGGGVAGLTAAHELAERGYRVTVYERNDTPGGKARSMGVPGTGAGGRLPLPGEHGFRFFPGFYRNIPDTLRRIPYPNSSGSVHGNLVNTTECLVARDGSRPNLRFPVRTLLSLPVPESLLPHALVESVAGLLDTALNLPPSEVVHFLGRVLVHITSCELRRLEQWEVVPWWEFINADAMSREYQQLLGVGITRDLVAIQAEVASTRTVGRLTQAFIYNLLGRGNDGEIDRVLNAPTSEAWITPWEDHLRGLGAEFEFGTAVEELIYDGGRITGVRVRSTGSAATRTVVADHYISAMPVQDARATWGADLRAADPRLDRCDRLRTAWMVGVQFYLRTRMSLVHGHVIHVDSPWALTSVSQAQFWKGRDFRSAYGDGEVADCLSVDISAWDKPGILYGRPAVKCTSDEVRREVLAQLKAGLNGGTGRPVLADGDLHSWFMDPAVTGLGGPSPANREQLLIHPVGTWYDRPSSRTAVPNLFLAGDYVATDIDLATMEGANESARRAVNALLDADGSTAPRCRIRRLYRPPELTFLHKLDEIRYRSGLPNLFDCGQYRSVPLI